MRPARNNGKRRVLLIAVMVCGVGIVLFSLLAGFAVLAVAWRYSMIQSPGDVPPELVRNAALIGQTRTIADLMLVYAQDHRGIYPTGKTSTEAFQKLLDGKYTSDPTVFYVDMPGKIRPTTMTLTSQNVCFDVTGGLTVTSSGRLPVAFTTGYIVDYSPGGGITLADETTAPLGGISVTFKNGVGANIPWKYDGIQRAFIEKDFDSKGSTFTQLRP